MRYVLSMLMAATMMHNPRVPIVLLALLFLPACTQRYGSETVPVEEPVPRGTATLGIDYAPETLMIWRVLQGSMVAEAGLQVGDLLLAVEGLPIQRAGDEVRILQRKQPGERVLVTVGRGSLLITLQVVLQRRRH